MKLKPLAFAMAMMAAGSAGATDINLGDVTGQVFTPMGVPVAVGAFLDRYFFQVNTLSTGSGTVADFQINSPSGGYYWNLNGLTADLFVDVGTIGAFDVADTLPAPYAHLYANLGTGDFIQNTGPILSGSYYVAISGIANGQNGGFYSWQATALPVPEAETWTMMGLGLGLIGLQLRRHSKSAARRVA